MPLHSWYGHGPACLSVCELPCSLLLSIPRHPHPTPFPSLLPLAFIVCARGLVSSLACDLLRRTAPVLAFSLLNNDAVQAAVPRALSTMRVALTEPFTEPTGAPAGAAPAGAASTVASGC